MSIESMARVHWWSRHSKGLVAVHTGLLEGNVVPEIEEAWQRDKDIETEAMQTALNTVSLRELLA